MTARIRYGESEAARLRYETWMRSHGRMSAALVAMTVVSGVAVFASVAALVAKTEPRYFAATEDGGILPLVPVSSPYLTDGQVTNFAVEAVTRSLTIDFANWRNDLADAAVYFERPAGWNAFLDALELSGMLNYIRERRLVSTVVANGAAIVRSSVDEQKRYSWKIQIPLNITYESASEISRDELLAEVDVARLPTWESPEAVGVTRIVVRPGKAMEVL